MTNQIRSYKDICFKIGMVMTVFFISGMVCSLLVSYIHINISQVIGVTATYISSLMLSGLFLYGIPIIAAVTVFKEDNQQKLIDLYKKPPRLSKAIGNFPAMYGLGQITNFLTLLIVWLISLLQTSELNEEVIERSFGTMDSLLPPNILCGIVLAVHMIFAAAVFEEFLCRGVLLNALKPYGHGFAIIITGFLFGIMHGNIQQFTYTTVLGIVLAYITIQTGSLFAATLLHAMFNSLAAVMMLFFSTDTMKDWLFNQGAGTVAEEGENMAVLAGFGMFFTLFIGLLVAGIALAVRKLMRLKSYKADNPFSDITAKQKTITFFTSVPVIIMLLLTADRFAGGFAASKIYELLWK
jgi:hypothetical protein